MKIQSLRNAFRLLQMVLLLTFILIVSTIGYRLVTGRPPTEMKRNLIASVIWGAMVIGAQVIVTRRIRKYEEAMRDG